MALTTLQWILLMTGIDGLMALAGAFSFVISKKSLDKMLLLLVSFATGALLGGAIFHLIPEAGGFLGYYFLTLEKNAVFLLPFAAGGFLYITFADLLPEIFEKENRKKLKSNIIALVLGLLLLLSAKLLIK